jgi:hypothetical protein
VNGRCRKGLRATRLSTFERRWLLVTSTGSFVLLVAHVIVNGSL